MKRLRDLFIDGLLLGLPLALLVALVAQALGLLSKVTEPLAERFPEFGLAGLAASELLLATAALLIVLVLGMVRRSKPGRWMAGRIERAILRKLPGFVLLKGIAAGVTGNQDRDSHIAPVLVDLDDNTLVAFLIEAAATPDGLCTVFVPSAPTPAAGTVMIVQAHRVRRLDASLGAAMATVTSLGMGTQALIGAAPARRPDDA
jgi:uncharacterized membrane protein